MPAACCAHWAAVLAVPSADLSAAVSGAAMGGGLAAASAGTSEVVWVDRSVGAWAAPASAGAEESFAKHSVIRGVPAGVRPRFTLEDQGRSTTISSKRRHHIVSGSGKARTTTLNVEVYGKVAS